MGLCCFFLRRLAMATLLGLIYRVSDVGFATKILRKVSVDPRHLVQDIGECGVIGVLKFPALKD